MTRVLVNPQIRGQLGNLLDRREFVDESGDILGYDTPSPQNSEWECEPLVTDAELLRRAESTEGRELQHILRDLESAR
jgi:hypothetical protein